MDIINKVQFVINKGGFARGTYRSILNLAILLKMTYIKLTVKFCRHALHELRRFFKYFADINISSNVREEDGIRKILILISDVRLTALPRLARLGI